MTYVKNIILVCFLLLTSGCSRNDSRKQTGLFGRDSIISNSTSQPGLELRNIDDIRDKKIGVLLGSIHDEYARKYNPAATILQFTNASDLIFALSKEKVDVVYFPRVTLKVLEKQNPELGILSDFAFSVPIAAGFNKKDIELRNEFNEFLVEIHRNGIYDEMLNRWVNKNTSTMPDILCQGNKGVLRVGVVSDGVFPFSFMSNGQLIGLDIEIVKRFAAWSGKKFETIDLPFTSLLASLDTKKIDIITYLAVTAERKRKIDFSDPYYFGGVSIIAKKKNIASYHWENVADQNSRITVISGIQRFWDQTRQSFYNNIILERRYMLIFSGFLTTLEISVLSVLVGTILGALICLMRMSKKKLWEIIARWIISIVRGIPVLVLLMVINYIIFASVSISPLIVSMIGFGLYFGAYVSEIFRSAISSINSGQWEAGIVTGLTRGQTFRYIILPQAVPQIVPVYKGEFISLIKMTSIVGYIAVHDLTKVGDIIRSRTFDAFFPLLLIAAIYFLLAWLLTEWLDHLGSASGYRREKKIK